jgi:hypothetical protein
VSKRRRFDPAAGDTILARLGVYGSYRVSITGRRGLLGLLIDPIFVDES